MRASKRDVKDGKLEDAARDAEQIRAFRDTWELGIHSYLSYLRDRLVVARDLLTDSGSVFVQIGDENVHRVRALMDEVFGPENYVAQIPFRKKLMPLGAKTLESMNDHIVWFAKRIETIKYRQLYLKATPRVESRWTSVELKDGTRRKLQGEERRDLSQLPDGSRVYRLVSQTAPSYSPSGVYDFEMDGVKYRPGPGQSWVTSAEKMSILRDIGRLEVERGLPSYVMFHDDFPFQKLTSPWNDTAPAQDPRYVVQTNPSVVARCMMMCTDPGDLVLDPTCGSGTTAFVAEQWGRRWITIDTSRVALAIGRQRLMGAKYPYFFLADSDQGREAEGLSPARTASDLSSGFVYKKVQHITLKSIVNNPDIVSGMSPAQIDNAIKRHADFEILYDQPMEDTNRVRVAGPFTVESLSPHRSLALDQSAELRSESVRDESRSFEQSIISNLRAAGIQNGRKNERLVFDSIDVHPGAFIQGIGEQKESGERVGITIGPQYGTVSATFIKQAAREAVEAGVPLLAVLGFAFDPNLGVQSDNEGFAVVAGVRDLGKVKVLVVRMNVDLLMGDELKKTGSGNLFTVFGEPDLSLRKTDDQWVVEVRGVDVYDPTSGDVRSNSTKEIALWMVDTDYDGESFFVRHAYFLGDNDPFKSLKTALKADIDPDAWSTLYRAESVPFDTPSTGKIAVKVINDYGDEVMKVLEVK